MKCSKCGMEISSNSKFCANCGNRIEEAVKVENLSRKDNNNSSKKSNKGVVVLVSLLIILIAGGIFAYFMLINGKKQNSTNIEKINKAFANYAENANQSGTIKASVEFKSADLMNLDIKLNSFVKYEKVNDSYNYQIGVNKTLFNEEFSIYSTISESDIKVYIPSYILRLIRIVNTNDDFWLKYDLNFSEFGLNYKDLDTSSDNNQFIKLNSNLKDNNLKYIGKEDNLNHYQIIVDKDLLKQLINSGELDSVEGIDLDEYLKNDFIIDLYIDKSQNISKISFDLSKFVSSEEFKMDKLLFTFEFTDLNSTKIVIPAEALNTTKDLEQYLQNNSNLDDLFGTFLD